MFVSLLFKAKFHTYKSSRLEPEITLTNEVVGIWRLLTG
jgi:hypothetical protein